MSVPRLKRVHVRAVRVPLRRPVVAKIGTFDTWPLLLIDLHTDQGIVGSSYVQPYLEGAIRYLAPMIEDLAEARAGEPLAPATDYDRMCGSMHLLGRQGLALTAISALDMAAWDAMAKAADLPLCTYLGGEVGPVRAYNTSGLWLGTPTSALGEEAGELIAEGNFEALKLRLGRGRVEDDMAAIRAVRDAVGSDVSLMVDFNQGLTRGDALHLCHALDDHGIYWFEEPLAYDDLAGYAELARELRTPIQLGENFYGPRAMYDAIQAGACDYVMPDAGRIGGVTGWLRAMAVAEAAGIEMSSHLYPEVSGHLLRVTPTAHWLEWCDWTAPILQTAVAIRDGCLMVSERPGLGITWDEDAVSRYRIDI